MITQWLKKVAFKNKKVNPNQRAKKEQFRNALAFLFMGGCCYGFYLYSATPQKTPKPAKKPVFDGVFDRAFNQLSDEAVLATQQRQIDALKALVDKNKKEKKKIPEALPEDKALLAEMKKRLDALERENKDMHGKLQVALLKNAKTQLAMVDTKPLSRQEIVAHKRARINEEKAFYERASLETVHFNYRSDPKEERTPENYVWAGTFVEGFMITGAKGDAGINGSKNMGTLMVQLDSDGIMPNNRHSRLKGCVAILSTYGDLSDDSVVSHLETLSCAKPNLSLEQKVYGSVYDIDAMQDIRGTTILKTKPLLEYSAAAGILAGFGDGLKNLNTPQTINPAAGTITTYGQVSTLAQSAAGGAVSNPANKISDYIMKIADIYHPLVIARGGRRVSVMFTKGFWIDKKHQAFESGKAMDERVATQNAVTTTISSAGNEPIAREKSEDNSSPAMPEADTQTAEQFIKESGLTKKPLFSTLPSKGANHG